MIMNGGTHNGAQVLQKGTVDLMAQNHIGDLEIGALKTASPRCRTTSSCSRA